MINVQPSNPAEVSPLSLLVRVFRDSYLGFAAITVGAGALASAVKTDPFTVPGATIYSLATLLLLCGFQGRHWTRCVSLIASVLLCVEVAAIYGYIALKAPGIVDSFVWVFQILFGLAASFVLLNLVDLYCNGNRTVVRTGKQMFFRSASGFGAMVWLLMSVVLAWMYLPSIGYQLQTITWSATVGQLQKCQVVDQAGDPSRCDFDVSYTYTVDGQIYSGDQISSVDLSKLSLSKSSANVLANKIKQMRPFVVSYDSGDPSRSMLQAGVPAWTLLLIAVLLCVPAACLAQFHYLLRTERAQVLGDPTSKATVLETGLTVFPIMTKITVIAAIGLSGWREPTASVAILTIGLVIASTWLACRLCCAEPRSSSSSVTA